MKTFKQLVSEVSQPVSPDEKRFKDQHVIQKFDYPVKDSDNMFKGTVSGSAKRPADQANDANYDKAYASRKAPTSNIGESVELDESVPAPVANPKHTANFSASKHGDDPGMRHGHEVGHMGPLHRAPAKLGATKARGHLKTADAHRAAAEKHKKLIDNARTDKSKVYHKRAMNAHNDAAEAHHNAHYSDARHRDIHKAHHATNIANNLTRDAANKATKRKVTESEQIDEIAFKSPSASNLLKNRQKIAQHAQKRREQGYGGSNLDKKREAGMNAARNRMNRTNEEAEQIDEISKDLAGRYIKKAQISTADAGRDTMDDRPHIRKRGINKIVNRRMGTADAIRKLTGKARVPATESVELSENPMEEKPMMMNALRSMSHNMQGIAQYVAKTSDPEEWFQNKLAGVAKEMQTLYSYATAETMSMGEEAAVTEAKKITAKDMKRALAGMKVKGKDEVSLKKAPWEKKEDVNEITQSATKKMVNVTGPDGKVRTVMKKTKTTQYDDKGQEKIKTNEEVEYIDEAVKVGNMKLRDGSSVKVTKEDAKLLNQMFKDLNSANRRKMEQVMMTDKAGFEEIRGFAREAL